MAVFSPMSAAVNPSKGRPAPATLPLGANAPSVGLPLAFMLTGLLALCAGTGWLVLQPRLLATYHSDLSKTPFLVGRRSQFEVPFFLRGGTAAVALIRQAWSVPWR